MSREIQESLALAGIDEGVRQTLRETWPLIREGVPYALQTGFAPAAGKEGDPGRPTSAQLAAARDGQARHWEDLFSARFDDAYAASLRQVATIHAQVGLDPRWLISGYVTTLTELHSLVLATHCASMMTWAARSRLDRALRAVDHAVLFDLQLCVSAYTEQMERMQRDKLEQVAREAHPVAATLIDSLIPATREARQSANDLFLASQRRTYQAATVGQGAAPAPTSLPVPRAVSRELAAA
jgi:methyl-accepting chemotaxis protein